MKILFISNYSQLYGANRSLLTLVEYLKSVGFEVCWLLPSKGNIYEELKKKEIPNLIIPYFSQLLFYKPTPKYLAYPFLVLLTFILLPYIIYKIKKINPQLIYSNTSAENIGILIAKVLHKKHISHIREFMDLDHGAKCVLGNKFKSNYINLSNGVIYVSKAVASHVNLEDFCSAKHMVIYNGINGKETVYRDKSIPEILNLGIVGILDSEKGQDIAILYFKEWLDEHPNSLLHIWGDKNGSYKKKLYSMVSELGVQKNVLFHGFEKDADIIYGQMDVLLMCSKSEGFGRVTIEAMQRAIPVIGYNNGGTSELINNACNGYLYHTKGEFIDSLNELLISESHFNKIRKQAYEDANKNFSIELYCKNVERFVESIIGN